MDNKKKEISEIIHPKFTRDDINPDRRHSPKAAAAEETAISVLLQHPDFYNDVKDKLPPQKMVTGLNRRIYEIICKTLESGRALDISVFAEKLIPAEIGYLVSLQNSDKALNNARTVLKDCIEVILEEGTLINNANAGESSVEDWAKAIQNMANKKKKGN